MRELSIVYELYRTVTQLAAEAGLHLSLIHISEPTRP